jgi:hypothetical protein
MSRKRGFGAEPHKQELRMSITENPANPLSYAPELASKGYPVFPITPDGKNPTVAGGFYAATTDSQQIAEWIAQKSRKNHNVAFATGAVSGVVVIDADTTEAADKMREKYGEPTVTSAHSHKGGAHWYFRHPRNGKVTSGSVGDKLDRKGDGGYVLAPPSKGKEWVNGIPDVASLPVLPEELWPKDETHELTGEREMPDEVKAAATEAIAKAIGRIKESTRHEHMLALCRVLLVRGVSEPDAGDILMAAWGDYADLAGHMHTEIPNALKNTRRRIENDEPARGLPYVEDVTPGLCEELRTVFGRVEKMSAHAVVTEEERRVRAQEAWETCAGRAPGHHQRSRRCAPA